MLETQESQVWSINSQGKALIRKTPDVCGGDACIRKTRIMVWLLVSMRNQGMADAEILHSYPTLTGEDLAAAGEYNGQHTQEIAEAIEANDGDHDDV